MQCLSRSLWKKLRRFEKSTPPSVVAVVTSMSYAFFHMIVGFHELKCDLGRFWDPQAETHSGNRLKTALGHWEKGRSRGVYELGWVGLGGTVAH